MTRSPGRRDRHSETLVRAALIGAATGLRSQYGVAALSLTAGRPRPAARSWLRRAALTAATAEGVADKLPSTPSRLAPRGLLPRLGVGALTGAALARRHGGPVTAPVAVATASALTFSLAGAGWRRLTRSHPAAGALAEDSTAAVLAWAACVR
ncbi:hypothetical protein [Streptomyces sp. NPDC003717]|uniref:hypothetical protein n=1 Tax=Streptomyces sp. NPDC003717 TaxID=3154276 RepID=UPI0033AF6129